MTMLCKKLLSGLLALMLLLTLAPAALAEETTLKVSLTGLTLANEKVELSAVFDVYQDNQKVGTLTIIPGGQNTIALPGSSNVALVPVAGTYPAEYPLNVYGYGVAIMAGRLNIAPIEVQEKPSATATPAPSATATPKPTAELRATETPVATEVPTATVSVEATAAPAATAMPTPVATATVVATPKVTETPKPTATPVPTPVPTPTIEPVPDGAMFILAAEVQAGFELRTESGSVVLSFKTDEDGYYTSQKALPEGTYVLIMTQRSGEQWPEMFVDLWEGDVQVIRSPFWRPTAANLTNVRAAITVVPAGYVSPTPAPTAAPTAVPTAAPTAEPTAMLTAIPTTVPTAEPVAVSTAEPTAVPTVAPTVIATAIPTAEPTAEPVQVPAATEEPFVNNPNGFTGNGQPAKITLHAFVDENNNGSCGNGEKDMINVQVSLIDQAGVTAAAGATDKNGEVTLSVNEGTYYIKVTAPEGYGYGKQGSGDGLNQSIMTETAERTHKSNPVKLTAGKTAKAGIGLVKMGAVTGTVWNDLNGDGIWQNDEPGIPGIKMTLVGKKNGQNLETVTDEKGVYTFTQAMKGTFTLQCHVPDEYVFTQKVKNKKPAGDTVSLMTTEADRVGEAEVTTDLGKTSQGNNIGLMEGVIIEGVCFFDANYNGNYDEGDLPLPGVELRLARQSNNVLLQRVVSDENGEYHFVGQRGSTFTLRANLEKGYVFSVLGTGADGNQFKPNGDKTERRLTDITLDNAAYQEINLGAIKYGSIEGRVYYDKNFSGKWERGEKLESGATITLYDANGEKVATKKTDRNGLYTFTKLMPGKYTVGMEPKDGYAFTSMGGDNLMQAQMDGSGRTPELDLTMGQDVENVGAGLIDPAYVKGVFFADANDNGVYDQGEKPLAGTAVRLMSEHGQANIINMGQGAEFMFSAAPGTYYLQYDLPEGALLANMEGSNVVIDENGQCKTTWFTISTGDVWTAQPCGVVMISSFSGMTFTDSNGNSVMDADEAPLAGVTFTLASPRGETTVVSDVQGQYAFENLRPDHYTLTVSLPNGAVMSRIPNVELGLIHGKNTQTIELDLPMGTHLTNQDMGCVIPSSWTGVAYLDENYDGIRAGDEAPAVGEKIVLLDAVTGEAVSTVYTDASGRFTIDGIAPGEYELVYPLDEGNLVPYAGSCDFTQNDDMMTNGRVTIRENERLGDTVLCVARTTEISGQVLLHEASGNTPVKGAVIHLLDDYANQLKEAVTGEDGKYAFTGLMPGDYAVDVTIPEGYVLVENDDSLLELNDLVTLVEEADGLYGKSSVIDLRMAEHHTDMDVVMVLPGRLGDKVWLDLNGNGLQDGEEGGIPGVTIELLKDDNILTSTVSDQYGYYVFEELYPAEYTLRVTWPAEVIPTQMRAELGEIASVLQADGMSIPVRVESNKANYAADLGFVLVEEGKLPAGYGEGEQQTWKK